MNVLRQWRHSDDVLKFHRRLSDISLFWSHTDYYRRRRIQFSLTNFFVLLKFLNLVFVLT